jgi:Arc/MetJ family transcription regulator
LGKAACPPKLNERRRKRAHHPERHVDGGHGASAFARPTISKADFEEFRTGYCGVLMCIVVSIYTHSSGALAVRTNIEIDDALMAEAQKASGHQNKKQTVEYALRLMVKLRGQQEVGEAFGKYRWRGNLSRSRKGRGTG